MGQFASHPISDKELSHTSDQRFSYAVGTMQGYRLTQEDSHLSHFYQSIEFQTIDNTLITIDIKIFAVLDGHGGDESSKFLGENLSGYVMDEIIKRETVENLQRFQTNEALIIHKLQNSFIVADSHLYSHLHPHSHMQRSHGWKRNNSGSTAIMAVIINNEDLYTVNSGDSRLILSYDGTAKSLSFDHKPNHIGELIRINDADGSVSYNRVGGILALSRAFGDFNFKMREVVNHNYDFTTAGSRPESLCDGVVSQRPIVSLSSASTQVTCFPEVTLYKLSAHVEFIILACDGIYDVFSNQDLVGFIRKELAKGKDLEACIETVMEECLDRSDEETGRGFDNMTMFLVACQLGKKAHSVMESSASSDALSQDLDKLSINSRLPVVSAARKEKEYEETEMYHEWAERIREKVKRELGLD
ncbi:hypothetical protein WICPIJ_008333 [Wickerhamomyces pijperi]|uniref:protein-serine/threonine phosphatase n=1 Tax=Wickerhamomyces pijperi TaxID=599730 RepID=A0A9P8PXS1_WICPI|nr:hypothetical protein WICPIJ_008333 [Wickerhamomyces pijperi]